LDKKENTTFKGVLPKQNALPALDELKKSLLQQAFSGEL